MCLLLATLEFELQGFEGRGAEGGESGSNGVSPAVGVYVSESTTHCDTHTYRHKQYLKATTLTDEIEQYIFYFRVRSNFRKFGFSPVIHYHQ